MSGAVPELETLLAHAGWLERLSLQLCRDAHAAADAAQETWLVALRAPPRHDRNLRGFLAARLRNALRLRSRGEARRARREADAGVAGFAEAAADAAARAELGRFLTGQVLALPEPQRALVLLHYYEGESVAAVARRSALSQDAVRAHLRRARESLRARLRQSEGPVRRGFAVALAMSARSTLLPITVLAMKTKLVLGAAALAALGFLTWELALPSPPLQPVDAAGPADASSPAPVGAASAPTVAPDSPLPAERVPAPAPGRELRCRLVGLHPDAAWTTPVRIELEGKDEQAGSWQRWEQTAVPGADGAFAIVLPAWTATCASFEAKFRADDPLYLELDVRERATELAASRLVLADEFELPVQAAAVLIGRVVDPRGEGVAAARVCALPWRVDRPHGSPRPQANTAADGSFRLPVPMAAEVLVVAIPMHEASLSGNRLTGRNGAIADDNRLRSDLLAASARTRTRFVAFQDVGTLVLPAPALITGFVREAGTPQSVGEKA